MNSKVETSSSPRASLSVLEGIAIIVGVVIGIGIFKTPPLVASNVTSEAAFIATWVLGGLITLVGALCYAELATSHPHAGGEYHFLSCAYGRRLALLFAWARGTVIQTGAIAAVAFVFGDYASQLFSFGGHSPAIYAALGVAMLTAINLRGTPHGLVTQVWLTVLTVAALGAVIAGGLAWGGSAPLEPAATADTSMTPAFGMAMIFVLLTYGGWNEAAYISAEVRDGARNMVRVLVGASLVLVTVYCLTNYAYLHAFGLAGLRSSKAVGADLMRLGLGDWAAACISLIVVIAALSTLNGTIFTGARVYFAMGRDLPALHWLGTWDGRGENPARALLVQGTIALALVGVGAVARDGFSAMVDYTAPVFWFFLFLVGLAVFVLRWREPERHRPFRVPLYPITPALFCATCLYMLYSSVSYTGTGSLLGIFVVVLGLPLLLLDRTDGRRDDTRMAG